MLKKITIIILSKLSSSVIKKHKPFIIWITWTVGKTTTSNFVYEFMNNIYPNEVYISPYDYNWEIWLPLSILQSKSPNKNIFLWFLVFLKAIYIYFSRNYPKYLVLEYWIDRQWEMKLLTDIAIPDVAIILNISPNHVENFIWYQDYINEKLLLWKVSKKIIYNSDDDNLFKEFNWKNLTYSFWKINPISDTLAKNVYSSIENLKFTILNKEQEISVNYSILWDYQIYNILPVFLLGKILNINLEKTYEILTNIHPEKWRWTLIKWTNDSIIIDWSYNWWFLSLSSWIRYIQNLEWDYNKVLFLWEMRELWSESKKIHTDLLNIILDWKWNYLFLVWDEMKKYVFDKTLEKFGNKFVFRFKSSIEAGDKIRDVIKYLPNKSVVYVKWSQNTIFLEEGIKKFLFDIHDVNKLCRQSPKWIKIKEDFFSHIL